MRSDIRKREGVSLTPDNVAEYVRHGHKVFVETNAGEGSGFPDDEYRAGGAEILYSACDVYSACDMVVKVKEPLETEYPYRFEHREKRLRS